MHLIREHHAHLQLVILKSDQQPERKGDSYAAQTNRDWNTFNHI
jgi:hypothetical protein